MSFAEFQISVDKTMYYCIELIEQDIERNANYLVQYGQSGNPIFKDLINFNFPHIRTMLMLLPENERKMIYLKHEAKTYYYLDQLRESTRTAYSRSQLFDVILDLLREMYCYVQLNKFIPEEYFDWLNNLISVFQSRC